jgi:hypothetical protein
VGSKLRNWITIGSTILLLLVLSTIWTQPAKAQSKACREQSALVGVKQPQAEVQKSPVAPEPTVAIPSEVCGACEERPAN